MVESPEMVGHYRDLEERRKIAFRRYQSHRIWDPRGSAAAEAEFDELEDEQREYLRSLLDQLPFAWHIAHAYTPRETGAHGGADHIVTEEPFKFGRIKREAGDTLSRKRQRFWGLSGPLKGGRLPTSLADIEMAEKIVDSLGSEARE